MFSVMPRNDRFGNEITDASKGQRYHHGTEQHGFADARGQDPGPSAPLMQSKARHFVRPFLVEDPKADFVFPDKDEGHDGQEQIVERSGEDGGDDVTAGDPREKNGERSFEAEQWREAEENSNGNAAGNCFRSVANGEQLEGVPAQPTTHIHGVNVASY